MRVETVKGGNFYKVKWSLKLNKRQRKHLKDRVWQMRSSARDRAGNEEVGARTIRL